MGLQRGDVGRLRDAVVLQRRVHAAGRILGPLAIELVLHVHEVGLVAAVVAHEHHVLEAVLLEAARGGLQQALEDRVGHRDRAGVLHVRLGRVDAAFGHVGDGRGHDGVAQRVGDAVGQHVRAHVVLAQHHVRAVLLGAADGHDDGGAAVRDALAQLDAGQRLEVVGREPGGRHGAGGGDGERGEEGGGARKDGKGRASGHHHPWRTRRSSSRIRQIAPSVIALSARLKAGKV